MRTIGSSPTSLVWRLRWWINRAGHFLDQEVQCGAGAFAISGCQQVVQQPVQCR
jgi:hypothetical protein